ncbi:DNA-directed RNA polymerases I, II, and III subunit rpabc3-like [Teleopsis dalmanni]|uniref:DNA-directed RNA polymerases I, II, and III subunit rpabc3-like n=1 Tax=Teleopsis dalmanni TaxID=139649 RepID=UPI0018CDF678|nr:DNA-directed RNA polymerases I, II, and III subunit rpabc3-like [Teleopsis dalmanni]
MPGVLFKAVFEVKEVNPNVNTFGRCSNLICQCESIYLELELFNFVYPIELGEKFFFVLSNTLRNDGKCDSDLDSSDEQECGYAADYDYVIFGKITETYTKEPDGKISQQQTVVGSFGGLKMLIKTLPEKLNKLHADQRVYMLLSKVPPDTKCNEFYKNKS